MREKIVRVLRSILSNHIPSITEKTPQQKKRPHLNDDQRRRSAAKGKALGRKLRATCCCIVTPDTILRW